MCSAGETPSSCQSDCGCQVKDLNNYRCGGTYGNERQREKQLVNCSKQWVTIETCAYGCQQFFGPSVPASCLSPSGGGGPVDSAPSATISVPVSASPASSMSISVTGTDDVDVAQLVLYDSANAQLASFSCAGVQTSCSSTFTATAPATQNTAYTFKARSVDNAGQPSAFAVGTGVTTILPQPAPSPVSVSVSILPRPSVRFPLQSLFMRSVSFPDSDCVRPGESALLAVKVQNTGKTTLKGVSFTATVQEAGIYARSGPVSITTKDKLNRFLRFDVPDDTAEGDYYLRLTVANSRFSRTVHRVFTVSSSC